MIYRYRNMIFVVDTYFLNGYIHGGPISGTPWWINSTEAEELI
jgi:hypothetical protein